jgi:DNA repair exonuclease SbcCD ATPase subunit
MPVTAARVRRHVLSSLVTSALFLAACPPVWAQSPATAAASSVQSLPATSAVLIVDPPAPGTPESDAQWQRRIQTHVASIASEHHLRHALASEDGEARKTQWFKTTNDPAERAAWLRDHLHVRAVPGTSLIELALPDVNDPAERRTLLFDVVNTYLAARMRSGDSSTSDRVRVLARLRDKAKAQLQTLAAQEQQKQIQLSGEAGGVARIGAKEIELSKLVGEQIDAQLKAAKAQAEYEAAAKAIEQGQDPAGVDEYVRRTSPYLAAEEDQIRQLEVNAEALRGQVNEDNPKYTTMAKQLELRQAKVAQRREEATAKARAALLEELKSEAAAASARVDASNRRVETLKAELAELNSAALALVTLRQEEKGLRDQLKEIQSQLDQLAATRPAPGATDIHWHFQPEAVPAK